MTTEAHFESISMVLATDLWSLFLDQICWVAQSARTGSQPGGIRSPCNLGQGTRLQSKLNSSLYSI